MRRIRAEVDPRALALAGQMFDEGSAAVLRELAQNARRAGAGHVWITWDRGPRRWRERLGLRAGQSLVALTFRDDGEGCASPEVVLRLGGVGWGAEAAAEQPAGMGLSVLAGKHGVRMHSRRAGGAGWTLTLDREAFTGAREVEVEPLDAAAAQRLGAHGTEVCLLATGWAGHLEAGRIAARVMGSAGIAWTGNGHAEGRPPGLEGWADAVYEVDGIAYGVREAASRGEAVARAWAGGDTSVYGVQIQLGLHAVHEADGSLGYGGRVLHTCAEVRSGSPLPLTLPQRDRVADEGAAARVREQALRIALEHAARRIPPLRVDGATLAAGRRRGILLAEAPAMLSPWSPLAGAWEPPWVVEPEAVRLGGTEMGPEQRILLAQALEDPAGEGRLQIFDDERSMAGLSWYDAMRTIVRVEAVAGARVEWRGEAWRVQDLRCRVVMSDGSTWERPVSMALTDPTDGGLELSAEELHGWDCMLAAEAPPGAAEMEGWITSVFEDGDGGDGAAAAEAFARSARDAVLAWLGTDGDTRIRERMAEVVTAALAREGPAEAAHRGATIHWVPGSTAVVVLHEGQEGAAAGQTPAEVRIERRLRGTTGRRTLAEEAARCGARVAIRRRGARVSRAIGGGAAAEEADLAHTTLEVEVETGGARASGAVAWVAGTALARWWCRRRSAAGAHGMEPLEVLTLPVADGLLEAVAERLEEAGAEGVGGREERDMLTEAYGLDVQEAQAIWG